MFFPLNSSVGTGQDQTVDRQACKQIGRHGRRRHAGRLSELDPDVYSRLSAAVSAAQERVRCG